MAALESGEPGSFGDRVKELRLARGLSQADLAGSELSPSYVSLIEAGKRTPGPAVLRVLAERLDVPVEALTASSAAERLVELELGVRQAEMALRRGEAEAAKARLLELQAVAEDLPSWLTLHLRRQLAAAFEATGDVQRALAEYQALVAVVPLDPFTWASLMGSVSRCQHKLGNLGRALDVGEEAYRRIDELGLGGTDVAVGLAATLLPVYVERGDLTTAHQLAERVVLDGATVSDPQIRSGAYWQASVVAARENRLADALVLAERALAVVSVCDDARALAHFRGRFGWLLLRQDPPDPARAVPLLSAAAEVFEAFHQAEDLAGCHTELARAHLQLGAQEAAEAAIDLADAQLDGRTSIARPRLLLVRAAAQLARGDRAAARGSAAEAGRELALRPADRPTAALWRELGELQSGLEEPGGALAALRAALDAVGVPPPNALPPDPIRFVR